MSIAPNYSPFEMALEIGMKTLLSIDLELLPKHFSEKIPYAFIKRHQILPLKEDEHEILVAVSDPLELDGLEELRFLLNKKITAVVTTPEEIQKGIHALYHLQEGSASKFIAGLSEHTQEDSSAEDAYDLLETSEEAPVIHLLNLILSEAIEQGASDIHFEPTESDLKIRYRIDGVLQTRHSSAKEFKSKLLTRIKVLAKLDIAEHRLPQDGRIKLAMGGKEIDFRVSTIPITSGERIVLRILDKGNVLLGLDQIGMLPSALDLFKSWIARPEGIILVTGPTGSGKTTTLYSALCETSQEELNIMTIEDPVEYKLKGIAQMAVHPKIGLTFAAGLRHILRQDPDIVMIGEVRDIETAEIAIQSALTGHLVLTTLHTNDAPSALPRLIDMGIEPYLLSSTIIGVIAQRLVRKICPHCREAYIPTSQECEEIGILKDKLYGGVLYRGKGCDQCFHTGYRGRHGIYELLPMDKGLPLLISKKADASELRKHALSEGMISLKKHGMHLVKTGITTLVEVLRVARQ